MSHRSASVLVLMALLAGCGGNPFPAGNLSGGDDSGEDTGGLGTGGGSGGGGGTALIPENLRVNVNAVAYNGTTLFVDIDGLDSTPTLVEFTADPGLDVAGYKAFKVQEDALDRMFIALAKESQDGSTRAVAVADGGQFGYYFGGGQYSRTGGFDRPTIGTGPGAGQVSYAGDYAGVTNLDAPGGPDLIAPIGTPDPGILPSQASRVRGTMFMNVNFADNNVSGSIYNRVIVDTGFSLDDVILVPSDIKTDGSFAGTVEGGGSESTDVTGAYGGVFGGTDSASVAGVVHLTAFDGNVDKEQEHGIFVLTQCGQPGDDPVCIDAAP